MLASRWSDEFLEAMREVGDQAADTVIDDLFTEQRVDSVNQMLRLLVRNNAAPPAALPPPLRAFLERSAALPPWADRAKLKRGQELFCRYGLQIITILNCYSLPVSYVSRKGVQVLYRTARLYHATQRRVIETAHMIMDVMRPGGLEPGGTGIRSAQKVRLMHSAVRYLLLQREWDPALGMPINQEDMAGSLQTFAYAVIDGLRKLGCDMDAEAVDAYLHAWNVVGYLMGLREDLMPHTEAEARALFAAIWRRLTEPCPEGQQLAKALVEYMQYSMPGTLFDGLPVSMMRFFLGDANAEVLALEPADWTQRIITPMRFLTAVADDLNDGLAPLARVSGFFGRKLIEGLCWLHRGDEHVHFSIPDELRQAWKLSA